MSLLSTTAHAAFEAGRWLEVGAAWVKRRVFWRTGAWLYRLDEKRKEGRDSDNAERG